MHYLAVEINVLQVYTDTFFLYQIIIHLRLNPLWLSTNHHPANLLYQDP